MKTMYIAFSGTYEMGHKLGDCITMVKACYLFAENEPHDKIIISLNSNHKLNFLWDKFIDKYDVDVVYDDFAISNFEEYYSVLDERRRNRKVKNINFDTYKELYLRIHGGKRQKILCEKERGLGRKNIFEYYYYGQENKPDCCLGGDHFKNDLIYYAEQRTKTLPRSVFISPLAISQTNKVFTFDFWKKVVLNLIDKEIYVYLNTNNNFFKDIESKFLIFTYREDNNYRKLLNQIASQKLVVCGNTGIGWFAGATGTPLMAMEPSFFWFMDYRYKECGVESLKRLFSKPEPDVVSQAIIDYYEN